MTDLLRACLEKTEGGTTAPFCDYFTCRKGCFRTLERKGNGHVYGAAEGNGRIETSSKGLFGKNGTVPLGDRFCCENDLSILKRKEKGHLYGETERNRCIQTSPKCLSLVNYGREP